MQVLRLLVSHRGAQTLAVAIALAYTALFQIATQDLTIDLTVRPLSVWAAGDWTDLIFRMRAPFQFEPVAMLEAPFVVWLISPVNLAIGLGLGALTGLQIALVLVARHCNKACGLSPATGLIAALPGLLAGSACCAPVLAIALGIQLTAATLAMLNWAVPVAGLALVVGVAYTAIQGERRCRTMAA